MFKLLKLLPAIAAAVAWTAKPAAAVGPMIGEMTSYVTVYEDTLLDIARHFDLGFVELVAANPEIDPWLPGAGKELILPTAHLLPDAPHRGVVINLTEMRLYYFPQPEAEPETHPIGIGQEGKLTPLGTTKIMRKVANPTWYPPPSIRAEKPELPAVVPPGPDNPMGAHAFYLGWPLVRVHGTDKPFAVGRRVTHGCIRLYPEDIEHLYNIVPVGTALTVVDQPVKLGWVDGELYLEVHPSKNQVDQLEEEQKLVPELAEGLIGMASTAAGDQASRLDFGAILQASLERRGYPIRITR